MKRRLLTYCILLFLCFIDVKVFAFDETPDFHSLLSCISTTNNEPAADRMQLKGTDVNVNINGSIAEVTVRQQYKNNSDRIINGRYSFPVPERAMVHGMEMKTNEETATAKVMEQKTALEEFNRFKEEGKNALLLEQDRQNRFTMNLANIMPGETVDIGLSYTELLIPDNMKYQFVYPAVLDSGDKESSETDFNITVSISAGAPIQELMCNTHDIDIIAETDSSAKVILKDQGTNGSTRDYILNYRLAEQKMPSGLILSGGGDEKYLLFNEYVGSPGLKDVSVKFTDLKTYDLEPSNIPDPSTSRPVALLGKWEGEADGIIKVEGKRFGRDYSKAYRFVKHNSRKSKGSLERLWAGKRIERLSGLNSVDENGSIDSEITDLGIKHNVLTKNTSFIAFNNTVRKAVAPEEEIVAQALSLPEEEPSPEPVMIAKVPEPGFYILLIIFTSIVAGGIVRRRAVKVISRCRRG